MANQFIDLFRAGDYSAQGKGVFSEADVQQIVDNYDPAVHEAPIGVGHLENKSTAPAYGWFERLRRVGDTLQGLPKQVQPSFEEAVQSGAYKKRSVELYKGAKGWSLRRVAFLGAQPPEIKGLADIQFEAADKEAIEIEFSEESDMKDPNTDSIIDGLIAKMRESGFLPARKDEAKTFSEDDVKRIASETAEAAVKAAITPLEAKFSERDTALATAETKSRAAAAIAKVKAAGAWVPAFDKMGVAVLFDELATKTEVVEFGEGDTKAKKAPLDILVEFMEASGKIVPTERKFNGAPATSSQNLPANADPTSVQFDEAIRSRMKEKGETYTVAMEHVAREQPELTRTRVGGATAGQV